MDKPRPIVTHLGLGDEIVQSGLFVALSERYGPIAVPCYEQYETSVRSFYVNHPLISFYTLPHRAGWNWGSPPDYIYEGRMRDAGFDLKSQIRLGVYAGKGIDWDFTRSFYQHAGINYSERWEKSPIAGAASKLGYDTRARYLYVFIHDDPSRGFHVRKLANANLWYTVVSPTITERSILEYAADLEFADEIHVIDSAFFWLANALNPKGKLYLHCYARWARPRAFKYSSRQEWEYLW